MAGAALRGFGRALLKKAKPSYPKAKPRGTPTKAGLVARRAALRGDDPKTKLMGGVRKQLKALKPTKADTSEGIVGAGMGAVIGYAVGKQKGKEEAKAKETKEKLKKATEKHKKKTKEKREKYGKPHA